MNRSFRFLFWLCGVKDGVVGKLWDVMSGWQERAANVEGFAVNECGHFVPEEQPEVVLEAMLQFLAKYPA